MFDTPGFLGTKAALYMDLATLFFAILPALVLYSIRFAVRKEYQKHYRAQITVLLLTIIMVLIFEVGVRMGGGFIEYMKHSSMPYGFMVVFMIIHIIIALLTVVTWVYLIIRSYSSFKTEGPLSPFFAKHKKLARYVFGGIAVTSIMGVSIYIFLFVL